MKRVFVSVLFVVFAMSNGHCQDALNLNVNVGADEAIESPYSFGRSIGSVDVETLDEISGICTSARYEDCFWVNNDSGDDANIYLINLNGELIATLSLPEINRDWEAMAIGGNHIYIGEVGDNLAAYDDKKIYRLEEPAGIDLEKRGQHIEVEEYETMVFNFANGQRDCETMMYDPINDELVLVSKREELVQVFITAFIASTSCDDVKIVDRSLILDFTRATSGDISLSGDKILIKNYPNIYYWERAEGQSVVEALCQRPTPLNYIREPQGEAIVWSRTEDAFYTISEKVGENTPIIYKYDR